MLQVLLFSVWGSAALGLPAPPEPQPRGSQCVGQDCYALFPGPATFLAASRACERLRGHLMTVRSSVAADVISLLLSGDYGDNSRLWIGLKRPPGCGDSDHLGPLHGFQWVTGDNQTSYSKWARLSPETPCGEACVVVSVSAPGAAASVEPVWKEEQCALQAEGFLCEFHFAASCKPLAVESSVLAADSFSIAYSTPFGARGSDFQVLPVNSSATVAPFGVELVCEERLGETEARWGRGAPGAWDCGVEKGGCQYVCNQSSAVPSCLCPADTAPLADGRSCGEHSCEKLCEHFCVPNPDMPSGYSCMCATGYELAADQHSCEDIDDCMQVPSPCQQLCVNTEGGFQCRCFPGFDEVNGECVESVDPCVGTNCEYQCQPLGKTDYRCVCAEGFVPNPQAPHQCQMFCNQTSCPADCDPNNRDNCQCPEGYILDEGFLCTDIDECDNGYCSEAVSCRNLPGTYECICGPDSSRTGTHCDLTTTSYEGGSGEPPVSPTPGATSSPSPSRSVHSGVLIGISILSLFLVVALLALLYHLRKKQDAMQAELEYKCGVPAKESVLQQVRTEQAPQKL